MITNTCIICKSPYIELIYDNILDWEYGVKGSYAYYECVHCSTVQLFPFPTISDLIKSYPEEYPAYSLQDKSVLNSLHSLLIKFHSFFFPPISIFQLPVKDNCYILDVGSGSGKFLSNLLGLGYVNLYGLDFNQSACDGLNNLGIKSYCGIFLDFKPNLKFSLISMNHYIEHTLNPADELIHAFNLLLPKGLIIGTLPNFESLDRKIFKKFWGGNHVPRHTFQFSPKTLSIFLKNAGFRNIKIKQEINPSHIAISIQNIISKLRKKSYRSQFGRATYYVPLLLALTPFSFVFWLLGQSGTIKFSAEK